MKQIGNYLRKHKFIYWLVLVIISFAVYAGGQMLFGPPHWNFIIIMSIATPTGIVLSSYFNDKQ